jgi:hypothetical protein
MKRRETHWLGALDPEAFRRLHGAGSWAGIGLGFGVLALMAYYEAPIRWMIVTSFVFVVLALSEMIKDAAIWIEARVEEARSSP